jgi:selenocysteine lyase/cysteine desulfurase
MDWQSFRAHFPTTAKWAFLDHAAVAPLPRVCVEAMKQYLEDMAINGVVSFQRWASAIHDVRALAARLLNADPLDVAFIPSTSAGIGIVAEGFPWKPGDNIITAAEEYPANQYPWMNLRDRGVETRAIASRGNRIAIDDLRSAIDDRTRVVSLSAVEFASGYRNHLAAIGEFCRSKGVFFCVDAIQALGMIPFDLAKLPIDALAADGHKWLLGPEGAGLFWLRREWLDRFHPIGVGWNSVVNPHDFGNIDFRLKPHAGRFEGGTYNAAGIVGLGASIRLLLDAGIDAIETRVKVLTDRLCEQAAAKGWQVFSSRADDDWSGIVSLSKDGAPPHDVKKRCEAAGIMVNVRGGRLRVSPHCYNSPDEIDRLVDML